MCFLGLCCPEHNFHARGFVRALVHGSLHVLGIRVVACSGALLVQFALWLLCSALVVVVVARWLSLYSSTFSWWFGGPGPALSQFRISDLLPFSSVR